MPEQRPRRGKEDLNRLNVSVLALSLSFNANGLKQVCCRRKTQGDSGAATLWSQTALSRVEAADLGLGGERGAVKSSQDATRDRKRQLISRMSDHAEHISNTHFSEHSRKSIATGMNITSRPSRNFPSSTGAENLTNTGTPSWSERMSSTTKLISSRYAAGRAASYEDSFSSVLMNRQLQLSRLSRELGQQEGERRTAKGAGREWGKQTTEPLAATGEDFGGRGELGGKGSRLSEQLEEEEGKENVLQPHGLGSGVRGGERDSVRGGGRELGSSGRDHASPCAV
eukprot:2883546-Rhodomonas_salina.1